VNLKASCSEIRRRAAQACGADALAQAHDAARENGGQFGESLFGGEVDGVRRFWPQLRHRQLSTGKPTTPFASRPGCCPAGQSSISYIRGQITKWLKIPGGNDVDRQQARRLASAARRGPLRQLTSISDCRLSRNPLNHPFRSDLRPRTFPRTLSKQKS
jgi:hypothetical protein